MVSLWDICNSSWCQRFSFLLSFFHFVKTCQNSSSNVYKFFRGEFHILPYHYFLTNLILTDVTISSKKWCHLYNLWHYLEIYVLEVDAILRLFLKNIFWMIEHSFIHYRQCGVVKQICRLFITIKWQSDPSTYILNTQ